MLHAVRLNQQEGRRGSRLICIEPYPTKGFARLEGIRHVRDLCQAVPMSLFRELGAGDLLFVDSSHAVKTGSDTQRIYLEVIPQLPPGVFIHIHDITLPYLHDPDVLSNYWAWQETALLLALLTHNPHLSVMACESALHHDRTEALTAILSDRSEEHTSELQSRLHLVCRLLLEKKKKEAIHESENSETCVELWQTGAESTGRECLHG